MSKKKIMTPLKINHEDISKCLFNLIKLNKGIHKMSQPAQLDVQRCIFPSGKIPMAHHRGITGTGRSGTQQ